MKRFWAFGVRPYWVLVLLLIAAQAAAQSFPKPNGLVNDTAELLDESQREALNTLLKDVERQTTAEIAFVSVPTLNGMSVEEYANKLFKDWGIGQAKQDNGVLVLVAPSERKMRIEVGYGLEGVLPDGLAGEIIRTQFTPRFKDNDYPGGIRAGMTHIADVVKANHVLTAEEKEKIANAGTDQGALWVLIPFLGIFVGIGAFMVGLGARTKTFGSLLFGMFFSGLPFLMGLLVTFTVTLFTLAPLWLALVVIGYRKGALVRWRNTAGTKGTGWTMGTGGGSGWSSGSSSSSSSSSSGDSFGGGSSGGGGASGSW